MTATRKSLTIVLVFILFLSIYGIARSASVELVLPDDPVLVGRTFNVRVVAHSDSDNDVILAFGFDAYFDTDYFLYLGATVDGDNLFDTSSSSSNTDVTGLIHPPASSGSVTLATLSFQPILAGTSWVGIYTDLRDKNEGLFTFHPEQSQSNVLDISTTSEVEISAIPIPSTLILIVTGSIGILVFKSSRVRQVN